MTEKNNKVFIVLDMNDKEKMFVDKEEANTYEKLVLEEKTLRKLRNFVNTSFHCVSYKSQDGIAFTKDEIVCRLFNNINLLKQLEI